LDELAALQLEAFAVTRRHLHTVDTAIGTARAVFTRIYVSALASGCESFFNAPNL
jgi:hypothetical protein